MGARVGYPAWRCRGVFLPRGSLSRSRQGDCPMSDGLRDLRRRLEVALAPMVAHAAAIDRALAPMVEIVAARRVK